MALGLLLRPWTWKNGPAIGDLRAALSEKFSADAFLFGSGREGLLALFRAMNLDHGDEIIVQAYTCVVVPNAIAAAGATPVFVDIVKDTLSMDPEELRRKISPRTKAVICQHTFGIPAPLHELRKICDEHRVPLIEDCAHIITDDRGPSEVGMTGEFVMLSFGRDKAISGVTGGAIISRRTDVSNRLKPIEDKSFLFSLFTILCLLLYPLIYGIARPFYGLWIGKAFLKFCGMTGLLIPIIDSAEKTGRQSETLHALPNACAALALDQLRRLKDINDHRRMLTRFYLEQCAEHGWPVLHGIASNLPLQKFPMFIANSDTLRRILKQKNIHLNDGWTGCVICPESVNAESAGYSSALGMRADQVSEAILNLPTHLTMNLSDARLLTRELAILLA